MDARAAAAACFLHSFYYNKIRLPLRAVRLNNLKIINLSFVNVLCCNSVVRCLFRLRRQASSDVHVSDMLLRNGSPLLSIEIGPNICWHHISVHLFCLLFKLKTVVVTLMLLVVKHNKQRL